MSGSGWSAVFAAAIALAAPIGAASGSDRADVALVLAVDVSGSVDDNRFRLQREGIAAALDSDEMAAVVSKGIHQTIEVAVIEWAEEQRVIVPWTVLRGRGDLAVFAGLVRSAGRSWLHSGTDPAGGTAAADKLIAVKPVASDRRVIDVSGDGRQNTGKVTTADARDAAVSHDITLNGLPITSGDERDLDDWYRANVVGGPGAFLIVANGYEAFAEAFRQKLMLEVAGWAPSSRLASAPEQRRGQRIEQGRQAQRPAGPNNATALP
jgi:hypothetical protein